ncbi:MAG: hypothetical protein LBK29_00140 [Oscillospiraceae bacterium]|nr:hypothetical protein [Oscillospiraceae bacterium]
MENKLKIFKNEKFGKVRTVIIEGEPYFCLVDVCKILELENVSQVKSRLKKDGIISNEAIDSLGRKQEANFVNEANLYKTIFHSRTDFAENFQDWICNEVIPQIRKTGSYGIKLPEFTNPALAARAWAEEFERRQTAENQRDETIKTKAWIGNRREATAMATASAKSRECNRFRNKSKELEIELDKSKQFASVKLCEIKTKRKFDWHKLRNYCTSHELEMKRVFDSNYGEVNSYPAIAWESVYGVDIENLWR